MLPPAHVYVVRWPDGVVKVGESWNPRRWRFFMARGADLVALFSGDDGAGVTLERHLASILATLGPAAFTRREEGRDHLGASGSGYTECRRLDDSAFQEFRKSLMAVPA